MIERLAWAVVCAFVFTIPWEKSLYFPGVGTGARALGIVALGMAVVVGFARRRVRPPNLALALGVLFVGWASLTCFWSCDPPASTARAFTLVQLLAMAWVIWDQCREPHQQRQLLAAYVAGSSVAAVATIVRYVHHEETYYRRYAAAGFDPNDLGLTVALSIPLGLYLAVKEEGWRAWAYRASVILACAAVLLSASRTALVAAFAAFGFAILTWRKSDTTQRLSSAGLVAMFIAGSLWLAPATSRDRLSTIGTELTQGTLHNRTLIWKTGLKAFKRHPLVGVGAGAYPEAVRPWLGVPAVHGHAYVAHNTFVSVLVETGLVGFATYGLLLLTLVAFVYMMPDRERALCLLMLGVWLIGVSTLTWEHRKVTWFLFALIMTGWAQAFHDPQEQV